MFAFDQFPLANTNCMHGGSDEPTGRLALVFELMDMNMYEAIKGRRHYLPEQRVKYYMYQVLKAIDHMHRNGIFHRDRKSTRLNSSHSSVSRMPSSA